MCGLEEPRYLVEEVSLEEPHTPVGSGLPCSPPEPRVLIHNCLNELDRKGYRLISSLYKYPGRSIIFIFKKKSLGNQIKTCKPNNAKSLGGRTP